MGLWLSENEGGGGASTWGSISGTLSDQTDLQGALNSKLNITDIIDNLTSTDTNKALSANQGKTLNDNYLELFNNVYTFKHYVKTIIDNLYSKVPDVILTTTISTDLQTAIDSLLEGQILEVQTNASYDPIVIPTTKKIIIRAGIGWLPKISGARCIRLSNGSEDVLISGFIIENALLTGGNLNEQGACITFNEHQSIVNNIIFHNITMKNIAVSGSSVMLSYHWSVSGDLYYSPPQLSELSNNVAFDSCHIYKGCTDGNEGACINLRAIKNAYIANCYINNDNDSGRGIQLQGVLSCLVENNKIYNIGGGNAEAIKVDQIGTSPFMQTAVITNNYTDKNIEGIDIDDVVSAIVVGNECVNSSNEGISLDNDSRGYFAENTIYNCTTGILFESGSLGYLSNNNVYNNITNFSMLNGYSVDSSNTSNAILDSTITDKVLTEAVDVNIVRAYVSNNTAISFKVKYVINAVNSGGNQVESHYGEFIVVARNQNGTVTSTSLHPSALELDLPIGTGIADTFTVTNGTGLITLSLTATSGITPTSLDLHYSIDNFTGQLIERL